MHVKMVSSALNVMSLQRIAEFTDAHLSFRSVSLFCVCETHAFLIKYFTIKMLKNKMAWWPIGCYNNYLFKTSKFVCNYSQCMNRQCFRFLLVCVRTHLSSGVRALYNLTPKTNKQTANTTFFVLLVAYIVYDLFFLYLFIFKSQETNHNVLNA